MRELFEVSIEVCLLDCFFVELCIERALEQDVGSDCAGDDYGLLLHEGYFAVEVGGAGEIGDLVTEGGEQV